MRALPQANTRKLKHIDATHDKVEHATLFSSVSSLAVLYSQCHMYTYVNYQQWHIKQVIALLQVY